MISAAFITYNSPLLCCQRQDCGGLLVVIYLAMAGTGSTRATIKRKKKDPFHFTNSSWEQRVRMEGQTHSWKAVAVVVAHTYLEQVGQHDESLLPDDGFIVSQTGRDVGDVVIHDVGVANTQVAHNHHNVVAHRDLCADLQLSGKHRQVFLDQFFVLQTQLP